MDFRTDKLLHGGDYNPEQWLKRPDILAKDIDMLEESGCNVVSLGIFSWSTLEPEEGVFNLGWLQEIIDKLYKRGISTILATPSGAAMIHIKWMFLQPLSFSIRIAATEEPPVANMGSTTNTSLCAQSAGSLQ